MTVSPPPLGATSIRDDRLLIGEVIRRVTAVRAGSRRPVRTSEQLVDPHLVGARSAVKVALTRQHRLCATHIARTSLACPVGSRDATAASRRAFTIAKTVSHPINVRPEH